MKYSLHPPVLASLAVVRASPEHTPRSTIRSLALFTVERIGRREARFDIVHKVFDTDTPRANIIDGLCSRIPPGAELLVRLPRMPGNEAGPTRAHINTECAAPTDIDLIRRKLPSLTILPLTVTDQQLAVVGGPLGLDVPEPQSAQTRRSLRAPDTATAMWATYAAAFCRKPEARTLFAAYSAWRVLEQVRPIPF
ncbi:MAG: hypothetical protein CVT75_10390 [Alphaproteobacteria bacterium HGW-Alphaproteobacteria-14]|nr:MAG: hypothetical protein CVT75_10390 [Alphaproteobacteria bacterium HGW-Alphaproteobacteria-14]